MRDSVNETIGKDAPYAIGLRLSAQAAKELKEGDLLEQFKAWLTEENLYVYTINGFPYGAFHNTRVKEQVYAPDWTTEERLSYTSDLISIIAELAPKELGGSVSTLPGSFKEFEADENLIFANLYATAQLLKALSEVHGKDLHLGLEPEPLGHFENTEETIAFFQRFHKWAQSIDLSTEVIYQYIGINYDTCHFALQFEDASEALTTLTNAGLRISKIHLSNAIAIDANSEVALKEIKAFEEPTYLHQVLINDGESIRRYKDLPEFFEEIGKEKGEREKEKAKLARIHFHIPLHAQPSDPLGSTIQHTIDTLNYLKQHPNTCSHLEMETYTWGVLPDELQIPIEQQLTQEHLWALEQF